MKAEWQGKNTTKALMNLQENKSNKATPMPVHLTLRN